MKNISNICIIFRLQSFLFVFPISKMEEKREVEVKSLKKGNYAFIRSQPCRITEVTLKPKASVKGNERIYIVGLHVDTGKKYEDTLLATLRIDEILVSKVLFTIRYTNQMAKNK